MTIFKLRTLYFALVSLVVLVVLAPAYAVEIPSEDEQDLLIRTTLLTFNDANMTGNYSVLRAKASKEFQEKFSAEQIAAGFEVFRKKEGFFEEVATAEYDSEEKPKLEGGSLVLAGVFALDDQKLTYRLSFIQNAKI